MVGLATAYWMGLTAADSARDQRRMWNLATRAAGRQQAPVDDRAALFDQVAQLQAQLQQALWEQDELRAQCDANYHAWVAERDLRQEADFLLNLARRELDENHPINWHLPPQRRSHP